MKYTVALLDGLGNQMFCYAFAKFLEQKTNNKVSISLLFYLTRQDHNGLEIDKVFPNITGVSKRHLKIISYLFKFLRTPRLRLLTYRLLRNIIYPTKKCFYAKSPFALYSVPTDNKYFYYGHWQNTCYVDPIRLRLLKDFKFFLPKQGAYLKYKKLIDEDSCAVAVHIRMGDYKLEEYRNFNIFDNYEFFHAGIKFIKDKYPDAHFYVFSDDINACQDEFVGSDFTFVDGNKGAQSYLDMYLMSICKHNIISNSTFSWWAAYLNNNENKIVYAPRLWTRNTRIETHLFSPQSWIYK